MTYHDLIARNRRNSALLVIVFVLFIGLLVGVLGAGLVDAGGSEALALAAVASGGAVLVATWSYYGGGAAILGMSGARKVSRDEDSQLHNVVDELAIAAGVPVPAVYLIDDSALNAFATGRDPEHAAVAITTGLRQRLSRDELQAVLAHELSHVRHFDIRLAMLLATLVGTVVLITDFSWRSMRYRGVSRSSRGGGSRDGGGGAVLLILAILLSLAAPMLARLIQLGASREREYLADAGAVELTRNPDAMIAALRKLGGDREVLEVANRATAHLYIVQPIKRWEKRAKGLFSTHPPIEDRVRRIEQLVV